MRTSSRCGVKAAPARSMLLRHEFLLRPRSHCGPPQSSPSPPARASSACGTAPAARRWSSPWPWGRRARPRRCGPRRAGAGRADGRGKARVRGVAEPPAATRRAFRGPRRGAAAVGPPTRAGGLRKPFPLFPAHHPRTTWMRRMTRMRSSYVMGQASSPDAGVCVCGGAFREAKGPGRVGPGRARNGCVRNRRAGPGDGCRRPKPPAGPRPPSPRPAAYPRRPAARLPRVGAHDPARPGLAQPGRDLDACGRSGAQLRGLCSPDRPGLAAARDRKSFEWADSDPVFPELGRLHSSWQRLSRPVCPAPLVKDRASSISCGWRTVSPGPPGPVGNLSPVPPGPAV